MTNHEFCANWILNQITDGEVRVLDYGCGAGEIVGLLRIGGVNASGCDIFYGGGDYSPVVAPELRDGIIRRIEGDSIPFMEWSRDFGIWLDRYTVYRSPLEINRCYERYLGGMVHIEDHWLQQRLGPKRFLVSWLPPALQRLAVRKWVGLVFTSQNGEQRVVSETTGDTTS